MPEWIGHALPEAIALIAALIALYVNYRQSLMREWFRTEMTKVVRENCAGKVEFNAHVLADEVFQETIADNIEAATGSQEALLSAKFELVKSQVASVGQRVDHLTALWEKRPN